MRGHGRVIAAVAVGGGLGAVTRYGVGLLLPAGPAGFPWGTLVVNTAGCAAIGVLMVLVARPGLLRAFLGTGFLGGFTTFSAYALDIHRLLAEGEAARALTYLTLTPLLALAAVWIATAATRRGVA